MRTYILDRVLMSKGLYQYNGVVFKPIGEGKVEDKGSIAKALPSLITTKKRGEK